MQRDGTHSKSLQALISLSRLLFSYIRFSNPNLALSIPFRLSFVRLLHSSTLFHALRFTDFRSEKRGIVDRRMVSISGDGGAAKGELLGFDSVRSDWDWESRVATRLLESERSWLVMYWSWRRWSSPSSCWRAAGSLVVVVPGAWSTSIRRDGILPECPSIEKSTTGRTRS